MGPVPPPAPAPASDFNPVRNVISRACTDGSENGSGSGSGPRYPTGQLPIVVQKVGVMGPQTGPQQHSRPPQQGVSASQ